MSQSAVPGLRDAPVRSFAPSLDGRAIPIPMAGSRRTRSGGGAGDSSRCAPPAACVYPTVSCSPRAMTSRQAPGHTFYSAVGRSRRRRTLRGLRKTDNTPGGDKNASISARTEGTGRSRGWGIAVHARLGGDIVLTPVRRALARWSLATRRACGCTPRASDPAASRPVGSYRPPERVGHTLRTCGPQWPATQHERRP